MSIQHVGRLAALSIIMVAGLTGCRAAGGAEGGTPAEQKSTIQTEQSAALNELYAARPETRQKVRNAAGYGYFSNINVNLFLMSTDNGYGKVHDNGTGKDTYMKMAAAGVGVGLGAKDYRVIFIFTDPQVMRRFVESGWDFGGQADATAKAGNDGAAASGGTTAGAIAGMEIYQLTKNGLALQATVSGTKYWRDDTLNAK